MALAISIVLIAGVILAVGLFAAGRIDGMSPSAPDLPPGLADGPVTSESLRAVKLPVALRGYRMADVDEMIERAAAELDAAQHGRPSPAQFGTPPADATPVPYEAAAVNREPERPRPSPYAAHPDILENDPADG